MEANKAGPLECWLIATEEETGAVQYAPSLKEWLDNMAADAKQSMAGVWTIRFTTISATVHADRFEELVESHAKFTIQFTLENQDLGEVARDFGYKNIR